MGVATDGKYFYEAIKKLQEDMVKNTSDILSICSEHLRRLDKLENPQSKILVDYTNKLCNY
jgi:hypothetical protein